MRPRTPARSSRYRVQRSPLELRICTHVLVLLQVTLSLAATLVAYSSVVLGKKLNLAYSAKLYGIAFLIVTFGAVDEETTGTSVFLLASMVTKPGPSLY